MSGCESAVCTPAGTIPYEMLQPSGVLPLLMAKLVHPSQAGTTPAMLSSPVTDVHWLVSCWHTGATVTEGPDTVLSPRNILQQRAPMQAM